MTATPKPLVLIILDGFGHSESPDYNAIYAAKKPVWDRLLATQPHGLISGSGMDVGLPDGQMGNSEVGHMNLGAGRVVYQDFTRVTKAIRDGEFFENPVIAAAVDKAVAPTRRCTSSACSPRAAYTAMKTTWWQWRRWPPGARRQDLPACLPGWPRYPAEKRAAVAGASRRHLRRARQGPHRLDHRPLFRDGPRQPLGPRPGRL